jgi:hypothetical protein
VLDVLPALGVVELGTFDRELAEVVAHIGHDQRRVKVVIDQDRAEALSSKLPSAPPMVTAASDEMIWMLTISITSAWVGFTLPGMIDDPASLAGRSSA